MSNGIERINTAHRVFQLKADATAPAQQWHMFLASCLTFNAQQQGTPYHETALNGIVSWSVGEAEAEVEAGAAVTPLELSYHDVRCDEAERTSPSLFEPRGAMLMASLQKQLADAKGVGEAPGFRGRVQSTGHTARVAGFQRETIKATLAKEFGEALFGEMLADVEHELDAALPALAEAGAGAGKAATATTSIKVVVASLNVGNTLLDPDELVHWLNHGDDAVVVAIGLQESIAYKRQTSTAGTASAAAPSVDAGSGAGAADKAGAGAMEEGADFYSSDSDDEEEEQQALQQAQSKQNTLRGALSYGGKGKGKDVKSGRAAIRNALKLDGDHVLDVLTEHLNAGKEANKACVRVRAA